MARSRDAPTGCTCRQQRLRDAALEQQRPQGISPGSAELTGDTNPFELGLADRVSLDKGCYLGQETMAKLASKGASSNSCASGAARNC